MKVDIKSCARCGEDVEFPTLGIREDFAGEGFVESEYRCLDGDAEGVGLAISYHGNMPITDGDYLPHTLTIDEAVRLRDFLTKSIGKMRRQARGW